MSVCDKSVAPLLFNIKRPCNYKEEHIGREKIIQYAFSRLGTQDVQSFAIIGRSKSGKTSFVKYIQNSEVSQEYLGDKYAKYLYLYLDFCESSISSEDDFFRSVYLQSANLIKPENTVEVSSLEEISYLLNESEQKLILILDNFNLVITDPRFSVAFYEKLRSWFSTNFNIGCIVTSPLQLLELSIPLELAGSPFFNIFDAYTLKPLEHEEAFRLIELRTPNQLLSYKNEIYEIIETVGFNPYELQVAGYIWVKNFSKLGETNFKKSTEEVYSALKPFYSEIYTDLSNRQLRNIKAILENDKQELKYIDRHLIDYGWVDKESKCFISSQMERFFKEKLEINHHKGILHYLYLNQLGRLAYEIFLKFSKN